MPIENAAQQLRNTELPRGLGGRTISAAERAEINAFGDRARALGLVENPHRTGSWGRFNRFKRYQSAHRVWRPGFPGRRRRVAEPLRRLSGDHPREGRPGADGPADPSGPVRGARLHGQVQFGAAFRSGSDRAYGAALPPDENQDRTPRFGPQNESGCHGLGPKDLIGPPQCGCRALRRRPPRGGANARQARVGLPRALIGTSLRDLDPARWKVGFVVP